MHRAAVRHERPDGQVDPQHARLHRRIRNGSTQERQAEGIAAAKLKGVYKGRKPIIDPAKVRELKVAGVGVSNIARQLGIARQSVYRVLQ